MKHTYHIETHRDSFAQTQAKRRIRFLTAYTALGMIGSAIAAVILAKWESPRTSMCWHPLARKLQRSKKMSDTEKLAETADSGLLQPRLVRPSWMAGGPECDWPEDQPYENGNYYNKCFTCQADFIGHKRRCWCRKCHLVLTSNYEAMTPDEKTAHDAKVAAAIKDFWTNDNA